MVQSIFDEPENDAPREAPVSVIPRDLPEQPATPPTPVFETPFLDEQELVWEPPPQAAPPVVSTLSAPMNQLDGTQRTAHEGPHNVYTPTFTQTDADTVRRSGLAWSMGVVFVGAVVIMLMIGWGADLLFGSSPWGLVLGIVLGSVIGFIQFFRISSQIYESKRPDPDISPLMSGSDETEKDSWL